MRIPKQLSNSLIMKPTDIESIVEDSKSEEQVLDDALSWDIATTVDIITARRCAHANN